MGYAWYLVCRKIPLSDIICPCRPVWWECVSTGRSRTAIRKFVCLMFLTHQHSFENLGLFNEACPSFTKSSDEFVIHFFIWSTQIFRVFPVPFVDTFHTTVVNHQRSEWSRPHCGCAHLRIQTCSFGFIQWPYRGTPTTPTPFSRRSGFTWNISRWYRHLLASVGVSRLEYQKVR